MEGNGPERKRLPQLFKPGQSGNPAGRKPGSRNKLSENFLRALSDDFEKHGAQAIVDVREKRPHDYLKVCASLMPRGLELDVAVGPSTELRAALSEFSADFNYLRRAVERVGASPAILDAITVDVDDD